MPDRVIKCNNKLLLVAKRDIQRMSAQNVCVEVDFFKLVKLLCVKSRIVF